jgi:hypothetical protein
MQEHCDFCSFPLQDQHHYAMELVDYKTWKKRSMCQHCWDKACDAVNGRDKNGTKILER